MVESVKQESNMIQLNILKASLWLVGKQYVGGQEKQQEDQVQIPFAV